jgi:hypothetical protein
MRKKKIILAIFVGVVLLVTLKVIYPHIASLIIPDLNVSEKITKYVAPGAKVEAVLVKGDVGATATEIYKIYIVPIGGKKIKGAEIFIADKVNNLKVAWINPKELSIQYNEARIFHYSNFWSSPSVNHGIYIIEIQLMQK